MTVRAPPTGSLDQVVTCPRRSPSLPDCRLVIHWQIVNRLLSYIPSARRKLCHYRRFLNDKREACPLTTYFRVTMAWIKLVHLLNILCRSSETGK